MGYSKEYAYGKVNTSNAAELMKCCRPELNGCLLYTSPSPRDRTRSRMPSSA